MSHLGSRVTALVDGEVDHDTRDRMYAHVAHCASCRADLDRHRAIKAMLRCSAAPQPPPDTIAALSSLARIGSPEPPLAPGPAPRLVPQLAPPGGNDVRLGPRAAVMTVGVLSLAGLVLGSPIAGGGSSTGTSTRPGGPAAQLTVDNSRPASSTARPTSLPGSTRGASSVSFAPAAGMMRFLTPPPTTFSVGVRP